MPTRRTSLFGLEICCGEPGDLVEDIHLWVRGGSECRTLGCVNPHSLVVAESDEFARLAMEDMDWLVPDGIGVVMAGKLLGAPVRKRITGSDVFLGVMHRLNQDKGRKVFFLGSTVGVLEAITSRVQREFPNITVAGTHSPPFKAEFSAEELAEMTTLVNKAQPDVLWVGLTSPKQDKWLRSCKSALNVRFAAGVGAVFDFYSGNVKRPSVFFQKVGMEWLPRLLFDWRRLWRRTFISGLIYVGRVIVYRQRAFSTPAVVDNEVSNAINPPQNR